MQNLKILNKKEIKRVLALLEAQWGFTGELGYAFLESEKEKLYLANRELFSVDISKIRVNSIGIYFADIQNGIRLTIEGSQIVGPHAVKNVVELSENEAREWMSGMDIEKETSAGGFALLRHGSDFLGSGRIKEGKILNFVPKARRMQLM